MTHDGAASGQPARLLTPPPAVVQLNFQAHWKNTPVGSYTFVITPSVDGRRMSVSHAFTIRVKIAFVTMFRYEHRVEESWQDGCLQELTAETSEGEGTVRIHARHAGAGIAIEGPNGLGTAPAALFTTTCAWHPAFILQDRVLDVSDGGIVPLAVKPLGGASVVIDGDESEADRYAFTSPYLSGVLWYRPGATLVRAEFEKKGHRVTLIPQP